MSFDLNSLVRPNILQLEPYSCARNEFSGTTARVFLDANENPYNKPYNRYPDPLQRKVKSKLSKIKNVPENCIFIGNGSDEAIDLVYRCFCVPNVDNVVAIEPTYGMYKVCASINDVEYRAVPLDEHYQINADELLAQCDGKTKVIWLCSPNNPTGNNIDRDAIERIINNFNGIVVVDEAYGDFSSQRSFRNDLSKYPNLVVLNTMSKAWGCAALRLGIAFADSRIINIFNNVKYPYNINQLAQEKALEFLANPYDVDQWVKIILLERERVIDALRKLPLCIKIYPTDANFFLVKTPDANAVYDYLVDKGIIVRNRNKVSLCGNCLRITVGSKSENNELIAALRLLSERMR